MSKKDGNIMPTRHNISRGDETYAGDAFHPGYSPDGRAGVRWSHVLVKDYGAPVAAGGEKLIKDATTTELPDTETVTYTPATDGTSPLDGTGRPSVVTITPNGVSTSVWSFDVPRNITSTTTHASSIVAMTILCTGYDEYLEPMSELITVPATGTSTAVDGKKAFKYLKSIAVTAVANAEANTLDMGIGEVFGLPVVSLEKGMMNVWVDGVVDAATKVVAVTTSPATTTTGDVRGTWDPASAADGTKQYIVWIAVADRSTKLAAFGVTQA